jgi:hypothetical protein
MKTERHILDRINNCSKVAGRRVQNAMPTTSSRTPEVLLILFVALSLATLLSGIAHAADDPTSIFIRASCVDNISSNVLSALKDEIRNSKKYRLVRDQSDEGRMDVVLTMNLGCTERKDVAAIATVFGRVKCFSSTNCHHAVDGSSTRADLCDANRATECGRALFKALDDYVSDPLKPQLKLN